MAMQREVVQQVIKSYFYVATWMSISCLVIVYNKWILAYSGFPFPITLTMWHMGFCSAIGFICVRVLGVVKSHNMSTRDYMRRVMPIGMLYAASLWLSNSSYLYLSVSFIQMTKSLMPGLVYASGVALGTEKFTGSSAANMLLIAFGVLVCALGEANLVMKGLVQQLAALGFEAARLTLVQILMAAKGLQMNPLQSLYYVSPSCLLCLLFPWVSVELHSLLSNPPIIYPSIFISNALAAFALNLAVFLLIGKTSALTMNIAGVIKDWMLIFFSYAVFHAPVTRLNLIGYAFCCSGVAVYNYQKLQLLKKRAVQSKKDGGNTAGSSGGGSGNSANGKGDEEASKPLLVNSGGSSSNSSSNMNSGGHGNGGGDK